MSGTVYVQRTLDGHWVASLAELPGCHGGGTTREEAVAAVRAALPDYVALLERHGVSVEHARGLDPSTFEVREPPERFTYPEDLRGMQEHELRDFLHGYEALHAALLETTRGLSQEDLEKRPAEDEWSVRETLQHVAMSNVLLLSRLEPWPLGEFGAFKASHRLLFQRFSVMDASDTQGEYRILGRRWSVKKVARQILEHYYEHLRQARRAIERLGIKR